MDEVETGLMEDGSGCGAGWCFEVQVVIEIEKDSLSAGSFPGTELRGGRLVVPNVRRRVAKCLDQLRSGDRNSKDSGGSPGH